MFKDIIETIAKELQNERNQEHLYTVIEPLSYRVKTSFWVVVVLLILMVGNLIYSNILLSEVVKNGKKPALTN